jgi:hypothetical protein
VLGLGGRGADPLCLPSHRVATSLVERPLAEVEHDACHDGQGLKVDCLACTVD